MDPRDEQRARYGLLPIFVDEPRLLTQEEINEWIVGYVGEEAEGMREQWRRLLPNYEPCVLRGDLFWRKRTVQP